MVMIIGVSYHHRQEEQRRAKRAKRSKFFNSQKHSLLSHTHNPNTILYKQQQHRNVKAAAKATTNNDADEPAAAVLKGSAVTAAAIAALSGPLPANAAATAEFDLEAMYAEKGQTVKAVDRFEGTEVAKVVEQPKKAPKICGADAEAESGGGETGAEGCRAAG